MNETTFRSYIAAFKSAGHDEMLRHYAPDVTMSFANGATLEGHDMIRAFYEPLHAAMDEPHRDQVPGDQRAARRLRA